MVKILVVLTVLGLLFGIALLVSNAAEAAGRRARQAALAGRPEWKTNAGGPALKSRYRRNHPFNDPDASFGPLMWGPLPDGAKGEVFTVAQLSNRGGRAQTSTYYSVATVVFPRPLPSVSLHATADPRDAEPVPAGAERGYSYTQGSQGPVWAGLRGFALDPQAAAALFTPELLARTRALRADWRMDGYAATAVVRGKLPPPALLALVDNLAWFASLLPEEVRQAAALDPDPWPGPTAERPA